MNHSAPSIRGRRQRLGIISPQIKNPWTESQRNLLRKLYPQANSNRDLEKILGHTRSTITAEAGKLGLRRLRKIKPHRIVKHRPTYSADYQFFQKWTPQMAYVLGFAFGDGNLSNQKHNYHIRFTSKDREILEKIRQVMESNHPIKKEIIREKFIIYRLIISSKIIQKDLQFLGMQKMEYPCSLPMEVTNSFILGFLDADGCIADDGRISFYSIKEDFLESISNVIKQNTVVDFRKPRKHSKRNIYILQYTRKESFVIMNWVYRNASIYLDRKYQRYVSIYNGSDK